MVFIFALIVVLCVPVAPAHAVAPPSRVHAVQVVSIRTDDPAAAEVRKALTRLKSQGFDPALLKIHDNQDRPWIVIHIGKYPDRSAARALAGRYAGKTGKRAVILTQPPETFARFEQRISGEPGRSDAASEPRTESMAPSGRITRGQDHPEPPGDSTAPITPSEGQPAVSVGQWYIAPGIGFSILDMTGNDLDRNLAANGFTTTSSIDRSHAAFRIIAGYRFTRRLAVEAGYVHFKDPAVTVRSAAATGLAAQVAQQAPLGMHGAVVEGVASLDVDSTLSLFGKAGGFFWRGKTSGGGAVRRDDGIDPVLGVGADVHLWKEKALRLEYERFFTPDGMDFLSSSWVVGF